MFIILEDLYGDLLRINVAHIVAYRTEAHYTLINTTHCNLNVKVNVGAIDALLEEFNISIRMILEDN